MFIVLPNAEVPPAVRSTCTLPVYLEAGQLVAVVHTHWLDLWRFTVQVSVVQSFHLTLLIPEPSRHFLSGDGSGQVLTLVVAMETHAEMFDCGFWFRSTEDDSLTSELANSFVKVTPEKRISVKLVNLVKIWRRVTSRSGTTNNTVEITPEMSQNS